MPASNLFDLIGSAADSADFQIKFQKAKIISKGDPNQRWVKAIFSNGEECFLFPDDENTVQVKNYPVGTVFAIRTPRPCRNPGATKWTTQVLNEAFQLPQLKALAKHGHERDQSDPADSISEAENTASGLLGNTSQSVKAPKMRVAITDKHMKFIDVAAKKLGIDCGYKTRSKTLEVILDRLLASNYPRLLEIEHWAD